MVQLQARRPIMEIREARWRVGAYLITYSVSNLNLASMDSASDFDLESLVHLEQTYISYTILQTLYAKFHLHRCAHFG